MLFSLPGMYNCIYILPFLVLEDTSFANFASTSHIFDNLKMLLIEIMHPATCSFYALQILPTKILHLQSTKIHYRRYHRSISIPITSSQSYLLSNIHTPPQLPIRFLQDFLFAPAILHMGHIPLKHIHISHLHIPDSMVLS